MLSASCPTSGTITRAADYGAVSAVSAVARNVASASDCFRQQSPKRKTSGFGRSAPVDADRPGLKSSYPSACSAILCPRNNPLPMCPVRTLNKLVAGAQFDAYVEVRLG